MTEEFCVHIKGVWLDLDKPNPTVKIEWQAETELSVYSTGKIGISYSPLEVDAALRKGDEVSALMQTWAPVPLSKLTARYAND